jgi:hypothetical protein
MLGIPEVLTTEAETYLVATADLFFQQLEKLSTQHPWSTLSHHRKKHLF